MTHVEVWQGHGWKILRCHVYVHGVVDRVLYVD